MSTLITKDVAFSTVSKFLTKDWPKTTINDLLVTQLKGGYANTVFIIENRGISSDAREPRKVLIRFLGGAGLLNDKNDFAQHGFVVNTEVGEALIYQHQSMTGNGPKLYGVFPGGRIEEYIPSHTLTHEEASRPEFLKDLARAYARFHQIDLPLEKNLQPQVFLELKFNREIVSKLDKKVVDVDLLLSTDWNREMKMMKRVVDLIESKDVLLQYDLQFLNILSRDDYPECMKKGHDLRVVLIDYELALYGKRLIDLGGHFVCRLLDFKNETKISGHEFPGEEERLYFIREYIEEIKRLKPSDFDPNGVDNENHLMMETDIGALYFSLSKVVTQLSLAESLVKEPGFFRVAGILAKFYFRWKKSLQEKYEYLELTN